MDQYPWIKELLNLSLDAFEYEYKLGVSKLDHLHSHSLHQKMLLSGL
jgi:hypothetical protein